LVFKVGERKMGYCDWNEEIGEVIELLKSINNRLSDIQNKLR
jgi:hypothetical protein